MRVSSVCPVNVPSDFKIDEMFFSTTDPKGVILSGNAVFARVSGYPLEELVGQPHNIIRHPDMPRVVFRLLWDCLHKELPVAALVKNMAKDGRYYWVIALVTPVAGGYLSVRFKPSSPISAKLEEIYGRLRAIEIEHGDGGADGRAGMDAAEKALGEELRKLGFADYDSFMWKLLHEEMKSRDAQTGGLAPDVSGLASSGSGNPAAVLRSIYLGAAQAYQQINALYQRLDELTSFHDQLAGKSTFVLDLTHSIRFVSLSTSIKAAKLGEEGGSLGVIAQYLGFASSRTSAEVQRLTDHIEDISAELHAVIFNLAGARLQLEMILFFCRELLLAEAATRADTAGASRQSMIGGLQRAFHTTMVRAVGFLGILGEHLVGLNSAAEELRRTILALHVAQVSGKVESSRIKNDDSIVATLSEIQGHVESTARELGELGDITGRFTTFIRSVPAIAQAVYRVIARIEKDVAQLSSHSDATAVPSDSRAAEEEPPAVEGEPIAVAVR